jgi:hypothetical protein
MTVVEQMAEFASCSDVANLSPSTLLRRHSCTGRRDGSTSDKRVRDWYSERYDGQASESSRWPDTFLTIHLGVQRPMEELHTMTRHPNPFAALSELITRAFATLAERDNLGGRNAFVVRPQRSRASHSSTPRTPRARTSSTPHAEEQSTRPNARSETAQQRPHTDPH